MLNLPLPNNHDGSVLSWEIRALVTKPFETAPHIEIKEYHLFLSYDDPKVGTDLEVNTKLTDLTDKAILAASKTCIDLKSTRDRRDALKDGPLKINTSIVLHDNS